MRRLVWVAVGAAGGIVVYRRVQQALADARERGVVLSAQQVGLSAASAVSGVRALAAATTAAGTSLGGALGGGSTSPTGSAAARALQQRGGGS